MQMTNYMIASYCCSSYSLGFIFNTFGFVLIGSPVIFFPFPHLFFLPVLTRGHFQRVQCPLEHVTDVWKTAFSF